MTIREMLIERLVATSMDMGRLRAEISADRAEKEELRKQIAKLNHEKAEQESIITQLNQALEKCDRALADMKAERDNALFDLEESLGE
jgi:septal ring factor EnvC (AmiA/AmiB activator)